jgi:hypothetical protein
MKVVQQDHEDARCLLVQGKHRDQVSQINVLASLFGRGHFECVQSVDEANTRLSQLGHPKPHLIVFDRTRLTGDVDQAMSRARIVLGPDVAIIALSHSPDDEEGADLAVSALLDPTDQHTLSQFMVDHWFHS